MSKKNGTPADRAVRISNSFSPGEIQIMDFILMTLLRGGDPSMALRAKEFGSLCRKVKHMHTRAGEAKGRPLDPIEPPDAPVTEDGAGGSGQVDLSASADE